VELVIVGGPFGYEAAIDGRTADTDVTEARVVELLEGGDADIAD